MITAGRTLFFMGLEGIIFLIINYALCPLDHFYLKVLSKMDWISKLKPFL